MGTGNDPVLIVDRIQISRQTHSPVKEQGALRNLRHSVAPWESLIATTSFSLTVDSAFLSPITTVFEF